MNYCKCVWMSHCVASSLGLARQSQPSLPTKESQIGPLQRATRNLVSSRNEVGGKGTKRPELRLARQSEHQQRIQTCSLYMFIKKAKILGMAAMVQVGLTYPPPMLVGMVLTQLYLLVKKTFG
jgi:hypothetical protein